MIIILVIILALVVRLFAFTTITTGGSQDDYWFLTLAKNIFDKGAFELSDGNPYDLSQPLHPFLIGIFSFFIGDFFLSAIIVSILFSIALLIATYVFWRKIENHDVAILSMIFIGFSALVIKYSVAIRADIIYTFLLIASLFFIYKIRDHNKFLPIASVFVVLAALTRWEGYLLIPVGLISFIIWNRKEIFTKDGIKLGIFKKDYFLMALLIIFVPLFLWSWRSSNCCGSWIPSYAYQKQLSGSSGGSGIKFLSDMPKFIPWYFLTLLAVGLVYSFKKYKKYLPIYIYLGLELIIHLKFRGRSDQILYTLPLFSGFLSLLIIDLKGIVRAKSKFFFFLIISLFMVFFIISGSINGYSDAKKWGTRNDVIKESMDWLDENSYPNEKVIVGDTLVYSYFTDKELVGFGLANQMVQNIMVQNGISDIKLGYSVLMFDQRISYLVAYDSTMPWFYDSTTKTFAEEFKPHKYNLGQVTVELTPLKKFKANEQEIIIYELGY